LNLRLLYLGMPGAFSALPLERLIAAGAQVAAVVIPAPVRSRSSAPVRILPAVQPLDADFLLQPTDVGPSVLKLAAVHGITVLEVGSVRHPQAVGALAALQPDVLFVACFPFMVPTKLLSLPARGAYNLHPALLPRLRGPAPLFWTFRLGEPPGVTLHRMSERADAGDIVSRVPLAFEDGISYAAAECQAAQAGAVLMVEALRVLEHGTLATSPQDERQASYYAGPAPADFVVTPDWPARRAFNFMRGVSGYGKPVVQIAGASFIVQRALELHAGESMDVPYRVSGDEVRVRFADGSVRMLYSDLDRAGTEGAR
jgi:methionyl-tRNA formyltransferase